MIILGFMALAMEPTQTNRECWGSLRAIRPYEVPKLLRVNCKLIGNLRSWKIFWQKVIGLSLKVNS